MSPPSNFRKDLERLISSLLECVGLKWTRDFEEYVRNLPRGKPIRREDMTQVLQQSIQEIPRRQEPWL